MRQIEMIQAMDTRVRAAQLSVTHEAKPINIDAIPEMFLAMDYLASKGTLNNLFFNHIIRAAQPQSCARALVAAQSLDLSADELEALLDHPLLKLILGPMEALKKRNVLSKENLNWLVANSKTKNQIKIVFALSQTDAFTPECLNLALAYLTDADDVLVTNLFVVLVNIIKFNLFTIEEFKALLKLDQNQIGYFGETLKELMSNDKNRADFCWLVMKNKDLAIFIGYIFIQINPNSHEHRFRQPTPTQIETLKTFSGWEIMQFCIALKLAPSTITELLKTEYRWLLSYENNAAFNKIFDNQKPLSHKELIAALISANQERAQILAIRAPENPEIPRASEAPIIQAPENSAPLINQANPSSIIAAGINKLLISAISSLILGNYFTEPSQENLAPVILVISIFLLSLATKEAPHEAAQPYGPRH